MRRTSTLLLPESLADLVHPSRAALLVYDMQVGIVKQLPDGARIVAAVARLISLARAHGLRIAYTRHLSPPRPWLGATATRTAMRWQRQSDPERLALPFGRTAPASAIVEDLSPTPDDLVLEKVAMSAFVGTALAELMRDAGLSTLIVCGIATEVGIDPTLRHAADLGVVPMMVTDACGGGNASAADRAVAALQAAGDTVLTDVAALTSALDGGRTA